MGKKEVKAALDHNRVNPAAGKSSQLNDPCFIRDGRVGIFYIVYQLLWKKSLIIIRIFDLLLSCQISVFDGK